MNKEKIKLQIQVFCSKLLSALRDVIFSKKKTKVRQQIVFGILQYIFLPILCGILTAVILAIAGLEKLGLDRFGFANFPIIKIQSTTSSTYSGLMLVAGLGCVLCLILSRILKFGARLGHFDFISPPSSQDAMPIPSVAAFIRSVIRIIGIPVIVIFAALTSRELAKTGMLPGVCIDRKYQLFEVNSAGVIIVAAIGCLFVFLYDLILTILLRTAIRKEIEIKELK